MIARSYRFKFYLNARHVLNLHNGRPIIHPHTWELTMLLVKEREGFVQFGQIEERITEFLAAYENTLLNDLPSFKDIEPSTEAIGEVFFKKLNQDLMDIGWKITSIEVSENPARTYTIEDKSYHFKGFNPFSDLKADQNDGNSGWNKPIEQEIGNHNGQSLGAQPLSETTAHMGFEEILSEFRKLSEELRVERLVMQEQSVPLVESAASTDKCIPESTVEADERAFELQLPRCDEEPYLERDEPPESVLETKLQAMNRHIEIILENQKILDNALPEVVNDSPAPTDPKATEDPRTVLDVKVESSQKQGEPKSRRPVWESVKSSKLTISFWHVFTVISYAGFLVALFAWIFRTGQYPWGSDTWGHLFKGHFLYEEVYKGNLYPLYTSVWYNGIQPFRYWAPIPYYILLALEAMTGGDSLKVYNLFIGATFLVGAFPWLLMGKKFNKPYLGTLLGILWFILPDNLRVFFCEGNLPRVVVTTLFPYLLMNIIDYLEMRKQSSLIAIYLLMAVMTLCHAMIAAMTGITCFLFLLWYGVVYKEYKSPLIILTSELMGILSAGIWLFPALKGGIVSLNSSAASVVMERLTYHITQSLNPLMRMDPNLSDGFYFGVSILFIALLGMLTGDRFTRILFGITVLVFLGTTKSLLPIIRKLPMNDLFWMMRFTPMAMAFFLTGLLKWENIRKPVLMIFTLLVVVEGAFTLDLIKLSQPSPRLYDEIKTASTTSVQRIAMLDLSTFDSDPSYSITYGNGEKRLRQTFGWAWQGAATADNMVWVNTALTKGYYTFVFDRCLELGADTLMIKKALIADPEQLNKAAASIGYKLVNEGESTYVFQYPVSSRFATKAEYRGLAVGRFASNITYAFPAFQTGKDPYIDAYTLDELLHYETVFLSGFKYHDKSTAEKLVISLAKKGVRVVVDLAGQENDLLSGRAEFMGVLGEPIQFKGSIPMLRIGSESYYLGNLPEELSQWNTYHLINLDASMGSTEFEQEQYEFWGSKNQDNILFIGFNLPYYLAEVKDDHAMAVMAKVFGMDAEKAPARRIVAVDEQWLDDRTMTIEAPKGTLLDIASLDAFTVTGNYSVVHNLIKMTDREMTIQVRYPYLQQGAMISAAGIFGFILFIWGMHYMTARGINRKKRGAEDHA